MFNVACEVDEFNPLGGSSHGDRVILGIELVSFQDWVIQHLEVGELTPVIKTTYDPWDDPPSTSSNTMPYLLLFWLA